MSIYLGRVNQKLFNARQLLADLDAASDPRRRQMLLESLLLQLHLACHFHLRHIAAQYQCRDPEAIASVADLVARLDALDKAPAEAGEIQSLIADRRSWLSRLDDSWQQCFRAGASGVVSAGSGVVDGDSDRMKSTVRELDDRVPLVAIDTPEEFSTDLGWQWLGALTEMVERQRGVMVEC